MPLGREERVFLVRMWQERQAPVDAWRGSVQEIGTERKLYVTDAREVADFIAVRLADATESEPAEIERFAD